MHIGSLYSALASFLQARSKNGKWLLRIDDLDTPRNVPGAADTIIKTLEHFGLHWDDSILYQSQQIDSYKAALDTLDQFNRLYPCICSRKSLTQYHKDHPEKKSAYPGFCRNKTINGSQPHALRIRVEDSYCSFSDALQGTFSQNLAQQTGDFIVKRRDHIIAYQLAVIVDDQEQQVTEVVRGYDILDSTAKQIYLQQLLNFPTPTYMHIPVIVDQLGYKLSKQYGAKPVDAHTPVAILYTLLGLLKQNPPKELNQASVTELLNWALLNWNPDPLKKIVQLYA